MFTTDPTSIKVGQKWIDNDLRNADTGKSGRAKPKHRTVEIIKEPSLSQPGVFRILKAPKAPHTVGKLREFTRGKLLDNYSRI